MQSLFKFADFFLLIYIHTFFYFSTDEFIIFAITPPLYHQQEAKSSSSLFTQQQKIGGNPSKFESIPSLSLALVSIFPSIVLIFLEYIYILVTKKYIYWFEFNWGHPLPLPGYILRSFPCDSPSFLTLVRFGLFRFFFCLASVGLISFKREKNNNTQMVKKKGTPLQHISFSYYSSLYMICGFRSEQQQVYVGVFCTWRNNKVLM